jgi:hypothetical protein
VVEVASGNNEYESFATRIDHLVIPQLAPFLAAGPLALEPTATVGNLYDFILNVAPFLVILTVLKSKDLTVPSACLSV